MKITTVLETVSVKFCVLWIIGVTVLVIFGYDELLAFLEKYISPDGHLSSPKSIIFLVLIEPVLFPVVFLSTFKKWKFPLKYLPWYLALFGAHLLFFILYTNFVLVDLPMEDSILEWGTVVLALIASVFFFISVVLGSRFAFTLCIAWLIFALEEISWGQRILGIESPEFFLEHNYQQETNIHNFFINPLAQWYYNGFNLFLFCFFTWFRQVQLLSKLYKIQGISDVLRVSDKYGLWMVPLFILSALQYLGSEFVEEQWGIFGALLSSLLLLDLIKPTKSSGQEGTKNKNKIIF